MNRRTSALRIAVAILAACLFAPLASSGAMVMVAMIETGLQPDAGPLTFPEVLSAVGLVWLASLLIGTPLTLALIAFPIAPFWFLHHRARGGPVTFLLGGALAGFVLIGALTAFTAQATSTDTLLALLVFTLTGVATSGLIWRIAYARPDRDERSTDPAPTLA